MNEHDTGDDIYKKVARWLIIWIVIPGGLFLMFSQKHYKDMQEYIKEYVPEPSYVVIRDPTRPNDEVYSIKVNGDTVEYIYEGDPRIAPKRSFPPRRSPSHDNIDLTDPDVIEKIFETADFWELYERYAD